MNEQITIKYKEETLLKSEMTEREKAIWDDGYRDGYKSRDEEKDGWFKFYCLAVVGGLFFLIHFLIVKLA